MVGYGKACEIAEKEYRENSQKCKLLKVILEELLKKSNVNYHYNGAQQYCIDSSVGAIILGQQVLECSLQIHISVVG